MTAPIARDDGKTRIEPTTNADLVAHHPATMDHALRAQDETEQRQAAAERDLARLEALRDKALAATSAEPTSLTAEEYRDAMNAIGDYLDALAARLPWIAGTVLDPAEGRK